MKRSTRLLRRKLLIIAVLAIPSASFADFEVSAPDGRRVLLQDNGTWRYVEAKDKPSAATEKPKSREGELVLLLERKVERDKSCQFAVRLTNNAPYEVQNLVLHYSAYRANGQVYDTVTSGRAFASLKPGDAQSRDFEFYGLTCKDIARVQVVGGERCNMGDLNRWSDPDDVKGQCLGRVLVQESKLVRFDK